MKPTKKTTPTTNAGRLLAIDLAKGIAILAMVVLHYLFVLEDAQLINHSVTKSLLYLVISRVVAITFIGLSTIVLWYRSQQNVQAKQWYATLAKQVIKLSLAAALVTLATKYWLGETYVRFGILHLLAATTLTNGFLFRLKLPRWWYMSFGLLVILMGNWLLVRSYPVTGWEWLGLPSADFSSVDYVPILPWLGLTWLTTLVAPRAVALARICQLSLEKQTNWQWLSWCGRHSLAIYLLNIPLLLALLWFFA